jgi:TolB-like protein/DNA-binding SARP family transcriptional activator/Tfp pilus assembly protein PilF
MIELRTLGGVDLRSSESGQVLQLAAQPKRLALLVYLALGDSSGYRRRDSVVGFFWPELDTTHARGALRQALHSLRRILGDATIVSRGEEEIGVSRDLLRCDAVSFRECVEAARYDEALKLYRGDFLEGFFASDVASEFEQWIGDTRLELRRKAAASAWALANAHRANGDLTNAAALARRASGLSLEDEAGVARLISFLDELGDRGGALEAYDALETRLKTEYDAEPSPETKALINRVRTRTVAITLRPAAELPIEAPIARIAIAGANPGLIQAVAAPRTNRKRYIGIAAVMAAGLMLVAVAKRGPGSGNTPYSVAVVPLQDLSGDTSRAYIADGVTDQLITDLAELGTLDVINRRTMMTYRGSGETARAIANRLHADAVISGTIQSFGDTVRMTAQLVLARDDRAIWAQTFEGSRGDLLRMQREAARAAAQRIRGALTPSQQTKLPRIHAMDPEALDLYIKGRYFWNKRGPGLLKSIGLFTQALDLDPTFALAYSGMADAYVQLGYGNGLAPSDAFPKARAAATRALQLDSTLAEPHATLAFVHMYYDWDWRSADAEFRHAILLNPSYATAHEWYGLFLAAMGRFGEARNEEKRAEELDPLSIAVGGTAAWVLYNAGDFERAKQELKIVLREDSSFALGHLYLGRVYQATHNLDSAMAQYESTGPLHDWVPNVSGKGYVLALLGKNAEARATLAKLDSMSRKAYVTAYGVAIVYAALQQPDSAFSWLDRAVAERTNWLVWLNRDPRWDPIRFDPRFAALTHRIGLPK